MKVGGQIPWNVTPICETSQTYCLMGRRPMKDVLGNHLKDRLFHLVHWLSIALYLRKISPESINLQDLATHWIQTYPCRTKTSQETQTSLRKFLEPGRKPKVLYTAKLVKIFSGIIVLRHHTDHKQMGLLREQCAEWKKVRLRYCCNQVWMKNGGQIPWIVIPICETFRISYLMGRHHMKGGSECPWTDQWYCLEEWSNITQILRRTSQESINL